ncbi:MAG: hypothetical protein R2818_12405 [Flavobacteriales bacterium]
MLNDPSFQLGLVDHVAGQRKAVAEYTGQFHEWRALVQRLADLKEEEGRARSEKDFLQFQLDELDGMTLVADEQEAISAELTRAEHAEELIQAYEALEQGISGDRGAMIGLATLRQATVRAARVDPELHALMERLETVRIELKDIGEEAERAMAHISIDPARAAELRDRYDSLIRLQQKHRVDSVPALIDIREELRTALAGIGSLSERIAGLEVDEERLRNIVSTKAKAISKGRIAAVKPLANKVEGILHELGMPNTVFQFEHRTGDPGSKGMDSIRAVFSANMERAPAALDKVASGGELSRVMLALISLAADSQGLPTVIFDEIDTGVSGEVADRVGSLMARMGTDRQVLAITHLPQIASKADTHMVVSKELAGTSAHTSIRAVQAEERVEALAQMLSGRKLTKAALENARVLLKGDR